jgi:putative sigma-54 modulation protein
MRIEVTGQHLAISPGIRAHAEQKAEKLTKFYDQIQQINVRVDHEPKHFDTPFSVEVIVDVEHHDDFVARAEGSDVYVTLDMAMDKAARQLRDFKEKLKLGKRG